MGRAAHTCVHVHVHVHKNAHYHTNTYKYIHVHQHTTYMYQWSFNNNLLPSLCPSTPCTQTPRRGLLQGRGGVCAWRAPRRRTHVIHALIASYLHTRIPSIYARAFSGACVNRRNARHFVSLVWLLSSTFRLISFCKRKGINV